MTYRYPLLAHLLLLLLAAVWPGLAHAEPRANAIATQLVVEHPVVSPGDEVMLAIDFQPNDKWHGYWENPGDAGFGLSLEWQLPDGVTVGQPRYPVPSRLLIKKLMNHVYKGDYAVLMPLKLAKDIGPGPLELKARARWLACTDEVCVPEQADLVARLTIDPSAGNQQENPRFSAWQAALAAPLGSAGRYQIADGKLRIAVPWPRTAALENPHFFIRQDGITSYAAPQDVRRSGDELRIAIALRKDGAMPQGDLSGLLATGAGSAGKPSGLDIRLTPGSVAAGGEIVPTTDEGAGDAASGLPPLWAILLGAIAGGLLLNVMPCVFPILSLKALTLARAGGDASAARGEALAYTAGVMLACIALGGLMLGLRAAGEQVGWAFQLQQPAVVMALCLLLVAITANLVGLFELPMPDIGGRSGGGFMTGVLAAVVATPCSGPFMASAMGAALLLPPALALMIFAGLGLGLALPFLAIGFIPALRSRLPKPGAWMSRLRLWLALPMALTVGALLWLAWRMGGSAALFAAILASLALLALLFALGRRQRSGRSSGWPLILAMAIVAALGMAAAHAIGQRNADATTDAGTLPGAEPFSETRLAELRAEGRPVFLYFTADWCITCKANEASSINREATAKAFKQANVAVLVGDWTTNDPAITRFLQANGVAGVPLYLWYDAGAAEPEVLPQILTPTMLVDRAEAAK